jgi:hypothetical protein
MKFVAELKGSAPRHFSNPYDAMAALIGTEGEAAVYVDTGTQPEALMHRDAQGSWAVVE